MNNRNNDVVKGLEILSKYYEDPEYHNGPVQSTVFGPAVHLKDMKVEDIEELVRLGWDNYDLPNGKYRWRWRLTV